MSTFLFDKIIFGPVKSRRLGISLGINLLPADSKLCNYDCIYCECGWTEAKPNSKAKLPSRPEVKESLEFKLKEMASRNEYPDVITFAGNGEPTMHPDFAGIVDDTIELRDSLCPAAGIAVLSNATLIHKPSVASALCKVDQNILKLDTINEKTFRLINRPARGIELFQVIENLQAFKGKMIIQTLFLRGSFGGENFDNTSYDEISGLIEAYKKIMPEKIMIYTFERDTPAAGLFKISSDGLSKIRERIEAEGFLVELSA